LFGIVVKEAVEKKGEYEWLEFFEAICTGKFFEKNWTDGVEIQVGKIVGMAMFEWGKGCGMECWGGFFVVS